MVQGWSWFFRVGDWWGGASGGFPIGSLVRQKTEQPSWEPLCFNPAIVLPGEVKIEEG